MLDFADLLDGVDVTDKRPSDARFRNPERTTTPKDFFFFFGFGFRFLFAFRATGRETEPRNRTFSSDVAPSRDDDISTPAPSPHSVPLLASQERGASDASAGRRRRRVSSLHGNLPQPARDAALRSLREGACDVLVATDVAARGLDLAGVELVVHADAPGCADAYAHRAGRAGRPGCAARGVSLLLPAPGKDAAAALAALERDARVGIRRLTVIGETRARGRDAATAAAASAAAAARRDAFDADAGAAKDLPARSLRLPSRDASVRVRVCRVCRVCFRTTRRRARGKANVSWSRVVSTIWRGSSGSFEAGAPSAGARRRAGREGSRDDSGSEPVVRTSRVYQSCVPVVCTSRVYQSCVPVVPVVAVARRAFDEGASRSRWTALERRAVSRIRAGNDFGFSSPGTCFETLIQLCLLNWRSPRRAHLGAR